MEPKLSPQSQLILEKLKEEVNMKLLTEAELATVKRWCVLYEGYGAFAGVLTKVGGIVLFVIAILNYWGPWKGKQ